MIVDDKYIYMQIKDLHINFDGFDHKRWVIGDNFSKKWREGIGKSKDDIPSEFNVLWFHVDYNTLNLLHIVFVEGVHVSPLPFVR